MFTSAPHFTFAFHHPLMFPVLNVYPSVHVCASAYVYIEREVFFTCGCMCAFFCVLSHFVQSLSCVSRVDVLK